MRIKGKISSWNDEKGYGFIEPFAGGKRVFIHIKAFPTRTRRPDVNQVVAYTLSTDKQGRPCAANATFAGARLPLKTRRSTGILLIAGASIFLLSVALAGITRQVPLVIFAAYLIASLVTFIVYAFDKAAAVKGDWRTPESTLHMLSVLGGWPGALIAQQSLRHKSRKQPFRIVFWFTVIANCGAFAWLLSPSGSTMLRSLLEMAA